jgi:predicted transcriptional regulator
MIDFACRKIRLDELIRCSLALSKADYFLFSFLLESEKVHTVQDLSKKLSLDRTTVQKSIKKLVECGVVDSFQENLSPGGYRYIYRIKDKPMIKKMILAIVTRWNANVTRTIENW